MFLIDNYLSLRVWLIRPKVSRAGPIRVQPMPMMDFWVIDGEYPHLGPGMVSSCCTTGLDVNGGVTQQFRSNHEAYSPAAIAMVHHQEVFARLNSTRLRAHS